jgi:hypothetical protein
VINNELTGRIPSEIGLLKLVLLNLYGNELSGPIPSTLGKLSSLGEPTRSLQNIADRQLNLYFYIFRGSFPFQ